MITFRKAEITDSENLVKLVNSAYRGELAKTGWTTEAYILDGQRTDRGKMDEMIEGSASSIEVAEQDGKILGCVYLIKEDSSLYFGMLTVSPTFQNQGIGKLFLKHIDELAIKWNFTKIRMTVIEGRTELVNFYQRLGFQRTGNTEPFPEDPRYGIPKSGKLILEEFSKTL